MKKVTDRQEEILTFIRQFIITHKFPPTFREISDHFNISVRGAYDHIKALEKKGFIRCDKNRSRAIEIINERDDLNPNAADIREIPRLGVVAAGFPILSEENWDGTIQMPAHMLKPGNYFALDVKGMSMQNAGIIDGDIAIIQQQSVANNGDIVVAMVDDAVTLKRYFMEHNRVQLKAENPDYPSIFTREVKILGILAHIFRNYQS